MPTGESNTNMYGCTPCPKCGSQYRCVFANKPNLMQCDDCGYDEPTSPDNYLYHGGEDD